MFVMIIPLKLFHYYLPLLAGLMPGRLAGLMSGRLAGWPRHKAAAWHENSYRFTQERLGENDPLSW